VVWFLPWDKYGDVFGEKGLMVNCFPPGRRFSCYLAR